MNTTAGQSPPRQSKCRNNVLSPTWSAWPAGGTTTMNPSPLFVIVVLSTITYHLPHTPHTMPVSAALLCRRALAASPRASSSRLVLGPVSLCLRPLPLARPLSTLPARAEHAATTRIASSTPAPATATGSSPATSKPAPSPTTTPNPPAKAAPRRREFKGKKAALTMASAVIEPP